MNQPPARMLAARPSHSPVRSGLRSSTSPIMAPPNVPQAEPCRNKVRKP